MLDINGWEFIIIVVLAVLLIGPERLPEYAVKLRVWVRDLRRMAEGAKASLREQMGPEFDDVDWKAYDPRQYDPRRIVREALLDRDDSGPGVPGEPPGAGTHTSTPPSAVYDPGRATPYDNDAT